MSKQDQPQPAPVEQVQQSEVKSDDPVVLDSKEGASISVQPEVDLEELEDLGIFVDRSYQRLAGTSNTLVAGRQYICPVPSCKSDPWFRQGSRTPPLCEEHGQVLIPAPEEE